MYSDIGITTLLNRLKQSIASARDFAAFLKRRSKLEEDHAAGLKNVARIQLELVRRAESRGESYAAQLTEALRTHERMSDNGMQFALSLHQMHEDLNVLSSNMERDRKTLKRDGLDAEKRAADALAAMSKAKARYDGLAEDYDRARTGDAKGRRIGLKGPKSAEQYESDLLRKVQAADADYEEKVRLAKSQRETLLNEQRPRIVRALEELCRECDSGLTLQLQKYAAFNEKLLLGNGIAVSPLQAKDGRRGLRDLIYDIDNDADFQSYMTRHQAKVPPRPSEIQYEKHSTFAPKTQQPAQPTPTQLPVRGTSASQPGSASSRLGAMLPGPIVAPSQPMDYHDDAEQPRSPISPVQPAHNIQPVAASAPAPAPPLAERPPLRPVFGVSLNDLFARDQSAVPIVVIQCILAVDHFGLNVEGIYRLSGTSSHVTALRNTFDNNPGNLDFRNPESFHHDVNAVTTLMKQFFRELPDPLFPQNDYATFIAAGKVADDATRRDSLHQAINDLPDPHYATLRALVLHLHRVMMHERSNRMGSANLALCLAPSLMGTHKDSQVSDAALQTRVVQTILDNATAIFDED
ncbi:putative Rho GTPase activator [Piedraia hortae CBS 480.64]|uniref:Putative Rho GTPase activator n=1 Tax=Piedraia hortae CBS 480.64 TaxID=1314780 RepID=A0A6A7C421_9PEZI|nr:putative Rho GTPase activator [Piedraia hortae CBS 480.64]